MRNLSILLSLCVLISLASCRKAVNRTQTDSLRKKYAVEVDGSSVKDIENVIVDDEDLLIPTIHSSQESKVLHRIGYITSYNIQTRQPNWVAWKLTAEHTDGPYPRKGVPYYDENGKAIGIPLFSCEIVRNGYFEDMEVPTPRQEHRDWKDHPNNIDHGHLCPAADCKWDKGAMNQSFLLTNMCPQDHDLNGGDWDKFENKCRTWAKRYGRIYIVAGPIFNDSEPRFFGDNRIPIPYAFFKVVLCMGDTPKALGLIFENNGTHHPLDERIVTIDKVEEICGMDFFTGLPDDVENEVEASSNMYSW